MAEAQRCRADALTAVREHRSPWDLIVIGGGATGLGTAVDAAARGYDVVLFEQSDFAKGTSSRSTKLVHGGVRYLRQGNVALVIEALTERGRLRRNAPHLVHDLAFVVPSYEWWESPFYGVGLKVYDLLAGRYGFGRSRHLSRAGVIEAVPSIQTAGLRGGTRYFDGQFDDARLALALARTAAAHGATVLNYTPVIGLLKDGAGTVRGVRVRDAESGSEFEVAGKAVVNAAGVQADRVRRLDRPDADDLLALSQGAHIVLDRTFLPGTAAIMVPQTEDGRVLFVIPWHDVALVGTTDVAVDTAALEPRARDDEIDFILDAANRYLARRAGRADVRSVFAGIRPLVRADGGSTAELSREHAILIDPVSGLLTVGGGKWTTYRRMAADVVEQAAVVAGLPARPCVTEELPIHGHTSEPFEVGRLAAYGSEAPRVQALQEAAPGHAEPVHPRLALTRAEVLWACRHELARTVDDVLARRSRSLLYDARAASEAATVVAGIMAGELGRDETWARDQARAFRELASGYVVAG